MNWKDVFISHSSRDAELAESVAQFLSDCIGFVGGEIVCTSAVGYGLEFGTEFEKKLRKNIDACEVFIPILSDHSVASLFCLFEMGAAWGLKKPIKAIVAPGFDPQRLERPLSGLHYLMWSNGTGWIQLIDEIVKLTDSRKRVKAARIAELAGRVVRQGAD